MNSTERERPDWDQYCMMLASAAAERSPDPYQIVGAAAFREDHSTLATGYNGVASGVEIDWSDRDKRRPFVIHAEENCLKYVRKNRPYYLYVTLSPCLKCLELASRKGVKEIVYKDVYTRDTYALDKAKEYGITIRQLKKI